MGACNSSVVAGWEISTIDRLADIMKGNGTPQVLNSNTNRDAQINERRGSTFSNYMNRMTKKMQLELPNVSRQEDTLSVTETASVVAKKSDDGSKYINQYMVVSSLGRGSYGVVKQCFDTVMHRQVAMKIMNKTRLKRLFVAKQTTAYKLLETEIAVMKKMNHNNIVKLYEIIDDPGFSKLFIVMEYIPGGSIHAMLKDNTCLPPEKSWRYFRDLIHGLEYCHEVAGIIHRDIKPENLLVDVTGTLKIVDFGVAFMMNDGSDESKMTIGSTFYLAPEICKGGVYKGRKTDIWAAGVTLFRMVTSKVPFEGVNVPMIYQAIRNNEPSYPAGIPPDLKDLLSRMLEKDESKRITINEIKEHRWVTMDGKYKMNTCEGKISITEEDKRRAISSFDSVFAMAKIKLMLLRYVKRARKALQQKAKGV